jgi:hypothetical protein
MGQEVRPDNVPVVFSFRPWNPRVESRDDYTGAVERGYSQYLDCCRRTNTSEQTGQDPDLAELDPHGEGP